MTSQYPTFTFIGWISNSTPVKDDLYAFEMVGVGPSAGNQQRITLNSMNYQRTAPHADWATITQVLGTQTPIVIEGTIKGDYWNGKKARLWQGEQVATGITPPAQPLPGMPQGQPPAVQGQPQGWQQGQAPGTVQQPYQQPPPQQAAPYQPPPAQAPANGVAAAGQGQNPPPMSPGPSQGVSDPMVVLHGDVWRAIEIVFPRLPSEITDGETGEIRKMTGPEKRHWLIKQAAGLVQAHKEAMQETLNPGSIQPPQEPAPEPVAQQPAPAQQPAQEPAPATTKSDW